MNEIYFSGYGYFKTNETDYQKAQAEFYAALDSVGIEYNTDEIELRDANGNVIAR